MGALAANWKVAAMAVTAVRADFDETLDVHRNVFAEVAFDHAFGFDDLSDAVYFVFAEVLDFLHGLDIGLLQNLRGTRIADAVNVGERDIHMLVTRKVDACNSCHSFPLIAFSLSLTLLVFGIFADHPNYSLAVDDLAFIANLFY
jgi:hypothetical protein